MTAEKQAVDDEQVAWEQVAVQPDVFTIPFRSVERRLPRTDGGRAVDAVAELCDRSANLLVQLCEW